MKANKPHPLFFYSVPYRKEPSPYYKTLLKAFKAARANHASFNIWTGSHGAPVPAVFPLPF